jgi:hypothetical protein
MPLNETEMAVLAEIVQPDKWHLHVGPFISAMIRHWIAWLSGGIISALGFFTTLERTGSTAWEWWIILAFGLVVSSFQTWLHNTRALQRAAKIISDERISSAKELNLKQEILAARDTALAEVIKERDDLRRQLSERKLVGLELRDECNRLLNECSLFSKRLNRDAPEESALSGFEQWFASLEVFARRNFLPEDYDSIFNPRSEWFTKAMDTMNEVPHWRIKRCQSQMQTAFDELFKIKDRIK